LPDDATPENVRRWIAAKVRHAADLRELWEHGERVDGRGRPLPRPYGPRRLNRAINALYAVLDYAHVFHDAPKMTDRLRLSGLLLEVPGPVKAHFTINQVALVIEAAGLLDDRAFPGHKHVGRQALVATLLLSGLRIDEACSRRPPRLARRGWFTGPVGDYAPCGEIRVDGFARKAQMRLRAVAQLHRAERDSMRPNPLDVDPEQRCDLLGLEQSPGHRRVLAGDLGNPAWEIGAGCSVPAHGESPRGRRRARGAAPGVGTQRTCPAAVASPRAAEIPDSTVSPPLNTIHRFSEIRTG
jgi:hypothetical protein